MSAGKRVWGRCLTLLELVAAIVGIIAFAVMIVQTYQTTHAYAMVNGQPIGNGLVMNTIGTPVAIDSHGRFPIRQGWGPGCVLMIYGPPRADSAREFLGEYELRRRPNGEWETVQVRPSYGTSALPRQAPGP